MYIRFLFYLLLIPVLTISHSLAGTNNLIGSNYQKPDIATFMQIGWAKPAGYKWFDATAFFVSNSSGAPQLYRINEHGWPYQLTTFEDGVDLRSYSFPHFVLSWSGDFGIVGASIGGSELSQLFLLNMLTGATRQLTDKKKAKYRTVVWAKDDLSIIYNSTEENGKDYHIYRMEIASGKSEKIFGDSLKLAGAMYPESFSQDGNKLIITRWNSNYDVEVFMLDLQSGEYQKLTNDSLPVRYDNLYLMPDQKKIWMISDGNEDKILRLARLRLNTQEIDFIDDGWIDPKWEVEGLRYSRDYKYMAVLVNEDGYLRLKIREVESKYELPCPPLEGQLSNAFFASDGSIMTSFNGPTRAPDLWRWDPKEEELSQLTFSTYAGIDRSDFLSPELIHFQSFDQLEIPAYLYLPPGYIEGEPVPFVIHAHGGPSAQFRPQFIRNFQYLLLNGFGVLAVNPRGSSGYGSKFAALDDYKNRKNSLKDYKASVDWLIEKSYTKNGMIGIRGGSYGGYVVLGMITEYPELFSAAIDIVGIANFQTFLENTKSYRRKNRESEYGPLSDPDFLYQISPIHKADQIKTPLLVIHGVNDSRVPIGEARQIIKAIKDNGGVIDSLIIADEGHTGGKMKNTILSYKMQIDFLEKYLKLE